MSSSTEEFVSTKIIDIAMDPRQPVKVYANMIGQPSRSVLWYCLLTETPHEFVNIDFKHLPEHYERIHPFKQVPAIDDNGFCLGGSVPIARYLHAAYPPRLHLSLWPEDPRTRARVDFYLDWHAAHLRVATLPFYNYKIKGKKKEDRHFIYNRLDIELTILESFFEKSDSSFLITESPTVADLWCFSEVKHLSLLSFSLNRYTRITEFVYRMEKLPFYSQVFAPVESSV